LSSHAQASKHSRSSVVITGNAARSPAVSTYPFDGAHRNIPPSPRVSIIVATHRQRPSTPFRGVKRLPGNLDRISPGCVEGPLREFHVAADRVRTPVCDMATARGCGLDDKAIDEARAHRLDSRSPRLERHASQVEVDHLEVTRDASAHQAQITPGGPGEPSRVLRRRWEPRLVRLPRAQGNALVVALADRRQYAEPCGGISPGRVQG
jgi:hypothetical protein